jgi:hypothetical protein
MVSWVKNPGKGIMTMPLSPKGGDETGLEIKLFFYIENK